MQSRGAGEDHLKAHREACRCATKAMMRCCETHIDKGHIHTTIIFCAVNLGKKTTTTQFNKGAIGCIRNMSDKLQSWDYLHRPGKGSKGKRRAMQNIGENGTSWCKQAPLDAYPQAQLEEPLQRAADMRSSPKTEFCAAHRGKQAERSPSENPRHGGSHKERI